MEEPNSALVKALIDLDSYKSPGFTQDNDNLGYLQLETDKSSVNSMNNTGLLDNRFKKTVDKTERMNK